MKVCSLCKISKDDRAFYKRRRKRVKNYQYINEYYYGLSPACKKCEINRSRKYNPIRAQRERDKRGLRRLEVIDHYSNGKRVCKCCGVSEIKFLTMDHTNGGGNKHRSTMKWSDLYQWLISNGLPDGFQVLCFNCNMGRSVNGGICPHAEICAILTF